MGSPRASSFIYWRRFLFTIDGARIASPLGSHFFMISEATTRTYQTRIRIQKEAKVCIAASPGILYKSMIFVVFHILFLEDL